MPWPKPRDGETEQEFIHRCMSDPYIQEDIDEQEQRLAVCYSQWENRDKGVMTMELERKSFTGIELKKDKPGSFIARIAKLKVIDKDGDVTLPGAFPEDKTILISAYQHGSWMGALPVGKGIIHEHGDEVLVEGDFNLNTETGKEHYETLKFAPELQEWSYGFLVLEEGDENDWPGEVPGRILKRLDVFEASPVLRGAGVDTALLTIKSEKKGAISYQSAHPNGTPKAAEDETWEASEEVASASVDNLKVMCAWVDSENRDNKTAYKLPHHKADGKHSVVWKGVAGAMAALLGARGGVDISSNDKKGVYNHLKKHYDEFEKEPPEFRALDDGLTFADEAEAALAAVGGLLERAKSLADLRHKEGRTLSAVNRGRIAELLDALNAVASDLQGLLEATDPDHDKAKEALQSLRKIYQEIQEVISEDETQ